jgi:hypothetical protein
LRFRATRHAWRATKKRPGPLRTTGARAPLPQKCPRSKFRGSLGE